MIKWNYEIYGSFCNLCESKDKSYPGLFTFLLELKFSLSQLIVSWFSSSFHVCKMS